MSATPGSSSSTSGSSVSIREAARRGQVIAPGGHPSTTTTTTSSSLNVAMQQHTPTSYAAARQPQASTAVTGSSPPFPQQQPPPPPPPQISSHHVSATFTVPVRGMPPSQVQPPSASSSDSPPTPSPLSTSESVQSRSGGVAAAAAGTHTVKPTQPDKNPSGVSVPVSAPRESRAAPNAAPMTSASILAASASATNTIHHNPTSNHSNSNANLNTGISVLMRGAAPAAPPASVPPPVLPAATPAVSAEEEALNAKEVQRQQILAHANDLLTFCAIGNKVTSIRQCTSSFFVLVYQRLFDCTIAGIDRSPNTAEKRRHNVTLVLEQLRQHPYSLDNIAAEEVVRLNEDHISRLIMVFVQIAEDMRQQQQVQQGVHGGAATANSAAAAAAAVQTVSPENVSGGAEEYGMARNASGAYVPVGYTVAEVMPHTTQPPLEPSQPPHPYYASAIDRGAGYPNLNSTAFSNGAANANAHGYYRHGMNDFYVSPAPPLNGGQGGGASPPNYAAGGAGAALVHPYEGEESPSSVSYYLDSSAIPTDELLAEWYRNLVYPAPPSTPQSERDVRMSTTIASSTAPSYDAPVEEKRARKGHGGQTTSPHRHHHQRPFSHEQPHQQPTGRRARSKHGAGSVGTSSSVAGAAAAPLNAATTATAGGGARAGQSPSSPSPHLYPRRSTAGEGKKSPARKAPTGAARKSSPHAATGTSRTQLNAQDIVRRCQRLGETLDAREARSKPRRSGAGDPTSITSPFTSAARPVPAQEDDSNTSRLHRGLPVRGGTSSAVERHTAAAAAARSSQQDTAEREAESVAGKPALKGLTADAETSDPRPAAPPPLSSSPAQQQQQLQYHHHQQQQQQPPRPPAVHRRLVAEPPLTAPERDFLLHRPQQWSDAAQRDRKIERLRAARYLGDMQQLLRQRMRHEYDAQMRDMRGSLQASLKTARAEKTELMRRVRDENARYRAAYATLMEAAANEAQVPARVMSRHTAQLAEYYATSLQHSSAMCEALKRETDRRTRAELLQYAEEVSAWQQHFLL